MLAEGQSLNGCTNAALIQGALSSGDRVQSMRVGREERREGCQVHYNYNTHSAEVVWVEQYL